MKIKIFFLYVVLPLFLFSQETKESIEAFLVFPYSGISFDDRGKVSSYVGIGLEYLSRKIRLGIKGGGSIIEEELYLQGGFILGINEYKEKWGFGGQVTVGLSEMPRVYGPIIGFGVNLFHNGIKFKPRVVPEVFIHFTEQSNRGYFLISIESPISF